MLRKSKIRQYFNFLSAIVAKNSWKIYQALLYFNVPHWKEAFGLVTCVRQYWGCVTLFYGFFAY
jgi:hypothetical protein